ncbi:uncharacterized protein LOC116852285 [Odontomachus brunneus]|uniref:uncharacterized protein LOC116852285 n=1 Tax=Odontomachus brunneus TaxID=486640 RepID=UPI0013F24437|nr:uncharacterized protein LOC116852285 [Odontomachus brunneus]
MHVQSDEEQILSFAHRPAPAQKETWSTVVGRKKGRKPAPLPPPAPSGAAKKRRGNSYPAGQTPSGGKKPTKGNKLRPCKTTAITVICPEGKYAEALRTVKSRVSLEELGISAVKNRRAVTGALILEIPGPDGDQKANTLAEKMKAALADQEGVRVDRSVKKADFRVRDLEDSVTQEKVSATMASVAECEAVMVKVGPISRSPRGLGTTRVTAPMAVVKKVVSSGRLRVGWGLARVELLAARSLTCFRCLEEGHTRS